MKVPIPQDWDGETWCLWSVCWPDSPEWIGILQGLISSPALGYFWDGSTGTITQVQEVGLEISDDNLPLKGALMRCDEQLNELIAAISSLKATQSGGCGCSGGTIQPTTPGTEGGVPPEKFIEPPTAPGTPAYNTRKCKIANLNHQQMVDWIQLWIDNGVDDYIGKGFLGPAVFVLLTTMLSTLLGELITPFPIIDALAGGVIGFIAGIAAVITGNTFDMQDLVTKMNDNAQDLVCAFYSSTDAQGAKDAYIQVLSDAGASVGQVLLLEAVFTIDLLNSLYFSSEDNPDLEAALDTYTEPISCVSCGCSGFEIIFGNLNFGDLTGTVPFGVDAIFDTGGGCSRYQVQIDVVGPCLWEVVHDCPGIVSKQCSGIAFIYTDEFGVEQQLPTYTPGTLCITEGATSVGFMVRGEAAFTLQITPSQPCS